MLRKQNITKVPERALPATHGGWKDASSRPGSTQRQPKAWEHPALLQSHGRSPLNPAPFILSHVTFHFWQTQGSQNGGHWALLTCVHLSQCPLCLLLSSTYPDHQTITLQHWRAEKKPRNTPLQTFLICATSAQPHMAADAPVQNAAPKRRSSSREDRPTSTPQGCGHITLPTIGR